MLIFSSFVPSKSRNKPERCGMLLAPASEELKNQLEAARQAAFEAAVQQHEAEEAAAEAEER